MEKTLPQDVKSRRYFLRFVIYALLIKLFLFIFIVIHTPQSRFQSDSYDYLDTAQGLVSKHAFVKVAADGSVNFEYYRTPGYPVFLALFLHFCRFSVDGVILVQIFLTVFVALFTYQAAFKIDPKIGLLSGLIVLYDPPVSIFSMQILTETLFLFLISLYLLSFIKYLNSGKISMMTFAAISLAAATYVRPTSYFLGLATGIFMVYINLRANIKKAITHALIFLAIIYSLLGVWQYRNYKHYGLNFFCTVAQSGYKHFGLYKSYTRNKDKEAKGLTPVAYYTKTTIRSLLSLMTRPGPFKYFRSKVFSAIGNVFAYPWMVFWLVGLIFGCLKCGGNVYYQFNLMVIAYFIAASIAGVSLLVGERFRVPMVPFLAIVSAYGWSFIYAKFKKRS